MDEQVKEVIALTGKSSLSEAKGAIEAGKQAVASVETQAQEIATLKARETEREVTTLVDKAVVDGKITPAQKDWASAMGKKDVAMLRSFIETAPAKAPSAAESARPPGDGTAITALNAEQKAIAKQLGLDEKKFAASLSAQA